YLLTENRLRLLIATRNGQSEVIVPVDAKALQREIGRFLEQIGQRGEVDSSALALYETLARPLDEAAQKQKVTRLLLWLDGPLRYVPFGALKSSSGFLADRYAIEALARLVPPSTPSSLPAPAPRSGPIIPVSTSSVATGTDTVPSVRGLGVTQAVAGYDALPGMADELCYIVRGPIAGLTTSSPACPGASMGNGALAGEGFADAAFTAARFKEVLHAPHAYSVLHVGTHFSLRT